MKTKRTTHINNLIQAMFDRRPVKVKGHAYKNIIIQRMNMDGDCDIYHQKDDDVVLYDVEPKKITILI